MAILVQTEFIRKSTVRILVYVYDDDEALVAATNVYISIVDPDGEVVVDGETETMDTDTPGIYEHYYETTAAVEEGDYQIECDILDGSYHTFVHGHFSMKAGIKE